MKSRFYWTFAFAVSLGCSADGATEEVTCATATSPLSSSVPIEKVLCRTGAVVESIPVVPRGPEDALRVSAASKASHKAKVLASGGAPTPPAKGVVHRNTAAFEAEDARLRSTHGADTAAYGAARARAKLAYFSD